MRKSPLDIANAFMARRQAGDVSAITCDEAEALRTIRGRLEQVDDLPPCSDFHRVGFEAVTLSPYLVSLLRLEGAGL